MQELVLENPRHRARRAAPLVEFHPMKTRHSPARSFLKRRRFSTRADQRHHYPLHGFSVHRNPRISLREIFSGPTLAMGGGAVGASILSNFVVGKVGVHLPAINNGFGRAFYSLFIPIGGAVLLRKMAPNLARGMVIGGLANAFGQIVTTTNLLPAAAASPAAIAAPSAPPPSPAIPSGTAATSVYLSSHRGMGEYLAGPFAESAW